jgi:signal transduction histidine kinase
MIETLLPENSSPALATVVKIAMRSTERVQRLINSLLDIRRLEAGQPILTRKRVEVARLMEDARDIIQQIADTKHQQVLVEMDGSYPDLTVDGDMIRRVLVNLMENASKFTPMNGTIASGARAEDGSILFWVRDTGRGMTPEVQEKIFDKFISLQADNMPRGLGLGLAFCRLAVLAHAGSIWVESQLGEGSTFYFRLPAGAEA